MIAAGGASLANDFEGRVISVYVGPVMINTVFVPSAYLNDGGSLVPVMVLAKGSILANDSALV